MWKFKFSKSQLVGILMAALPVGALAGFGFGFDSDNGFYDYDPEDYWRWGGYPPSAYRDYNPSWRWGSRRHSSGWRFGSKDDDSGWRRGRSGGWGWKSKDKDGESSSWWHSRSLKDDDGWSSWGREWSFGREGEPTKFNFGSFDFGDRWSPSFGKKSWSFGRKPRWYRGWGYPPPPPYPGWAPPYTAPQWGGNPYGAVTPQPLQPRAAAPATGQGGTASNAATLSPANAGQESVSPAESGSNAEVRQEASKGSDSESQ